MAESLKVPAHIHPNMGDLVQREHPQIRVGIDEKGLGAQKTCNISKTVQDRTKVTMTD